MSMKAVTRGDATIYVNGVICSTSYYKNQLQNLGLRYFWQYSDHSVRNFEAHHQKRVVGVSNIYQIRKEGGTKRGGDHTPIGSTRGSFPP